MWFRLCLPVIAAVLLATLPTPADAQWRWRDKDGRVNASDLPPPREVPDKDILSRPPTAAAADARRQAAAAAQPASGAAPAVAGAPAPAPAAPPTALERDVLAKRKAAEQEQTAKAKADEERMTAQRADNCRAARSHLSALDSGQRIARINDKGEREVLDDKGRADETRRAREAIASDCR